VHPQVVEFQSKASTQEFVYLQSLFEPAQQVSSYTEVVAHVLEAVQKVSVVDVHPQIEATQAA